MCVCVQSHDIWYRSSFKEVLEDFIEKTQGGTHSSALISDADTNLESRYMIVFTWVLMRWWWAWHLLRYLATITRSPDTQPGVFPIRNNVWVFPWLCIEEVTKINNKLRPTLKKRNKEKTNQRVKQKNDHKIHKSEINSRGTKEAVLHPIHCTFKLIKCR